MLGVIKDIVSFFLYLAVCPFFKNKNAVLVYHAVDHIARCDDPHKLNVDPELFEKHLAFLKKRKERFLLTFDDGYKSIFQNAFPLIRKHGIKGIVFLTTDYLDGKISLDKFFDNRFSPVPLTWEEVREISDAGFEIGSHSLTHRNMAELDEETAYRELALSKERIFDMTGSVTSSFSYPFGHAQSFTARTIQILRRLGYTRAYSNILGMNNSLKEPFMIRRIRIYSNDTMLRFKMKIAGAYNWVDRVAIYFRRAGVAVGDV